MHNLKEKKKIPIKCFVFKKKKIILTNYCENVKVSMKFSSGKISPVQDRISGAKTTKAHNREKQ